ncbi:glycosyltransferase family 2 protein [Alteromonas lipolytica]|uniref:Glycosyltransferase 2-like domain-containing protein n=1 Tax=Alteromonas lipolytica TaxID=1856405 RepID=A0A1E8FAX0_9ALTE|nr:glycosyltransferase family 2 protein [Alteromonas lipolytica]OFI33061.1 hypothetical protein BFC17_01975 [Alteromonas lipolytica]GGF62862.1 glycosyl transferase family 2 [Alteromonas lipolytica]
MKQSEQPKVRIVILNWNGWRDTVECLESVFKLNYPNFQVIVCDNDSSDDSVKNIVDWTRGVLPVVPGRCHPLPHLIIPPVAKPLSYQCYNREDVDNGVCDESPLVIIQTQGNLGFAGGNNVGIRFAMQQGCDYVWLLNNDTVVEADALCQMVKHSSALRARGIKNTCGSSVHFYDDPNVIQALGGASFNRWTGIASQTLGRFLKRGDNIDHGRYQQRLDYITGCSWLIPEDFLTQIGLMEEKYFLYYEEIDWVLRSKQHYALTYAPESLVYHKEGSSIGSKTLNRPASMLSDFYLARNKFLLAKKFTPWALPVVYLSTLLQVFNRVKQGYLKKALLLTKVMLGKQHYP